MTRRQTARSGRRAAARPRGAGGPADAAPAVLGRPGIGPLWVLGLTGPVVVLGWALLTARTGAAAAAVAVAAAFALLLLRVTRMLRDVERQAVELLRLSGTDALTGLPNRRAWEEQYAAIHRRCATAGEPVAVLMIDLDHFKAFNDAHGHLAGDRMLQEAVRSWQGALRPGDLLARWGGEEFAACLPGCGPDVAAAVSARLLAVVPQGQTASVGLAVGVLDEEPESIVERADAALYAAKRTGRARTVVAGAPGARPAARDRRPQRAADGTTADEARRLAS